MNNLDKLKLEQRTVRLEIQQSQIRISEKTNGLFSVQNVISSVLGGSFFKSKKRSKKAKKTSLVKGLAIYIIQQLVSRI